MKKILSVILAISVMLPGASVNARAAGRTEAIYRAVSDNSEIHILYNDTIVKCDDVKPVNTDGRVMIPFRTALENMGAAVEYDDESRLVTAKKGDITIKFTLMDDIIYVDKNGIQSTITMDVPMIIVDERTLVPIRFMSNAFDMQVGWDSETETVIIMDYDDYFDYFEKIAPNLSKAAAINNPEFNNCSASFDFNIDFSDATDTFTLFAKGTAESGGADNPAQLNIVLNIQSGSWSLKDVKADAVFDGGRIYIRTDVLEQLAKNINNPELKLAAVTFNGMTWYSIDLNKLLEAFQLPPMKEMISNSDNITDIWKNGISTEGDAEYLTAVTLAAMFDAYEEMDQYITVKEKENGGYTININITNDDFSKIITSILGTAIPEEILAEMRNSINCTIAANMDCDDKKLTSDVFVDISAEDDDVKFEFKMTFNETDEIKDNAADISVPEESVDITDMILEFIK